MITWNSFKDSTPKQEILDQCDNKILICDTYSGDGGSVPLVAVVQVEIGRLCYFLCM